MTKRVPPTTPSEPIVITDEHRQAASRLTADLRVLSTRLEGKEHIQRFREFGRKYDKKPLIRIANGIIQFLTTASLLIIFLNFWPSLFGSNFDYFGVLGGLILSFATEIAGFLFPATALWFFAVALIGQLEGAVFIKELRHLNIRTAQVIIRNGDKIAEECHQNPDHYDKGKVSALRTFYLNKTDSAHRALRPFGSVFGLIIHLVGGVLLTRYLNYLENAVYALSNGSGIVSFLRDGSDGSSSSPLGALSSIGDALGTLLRIILDWDYLFKPLLIFLLVVVAISLPIGGFLMKREKKLLDAIQNDPNWEMPAAMRGYFSGTAQNGAEPVAYISSQSILVSILLTLLTCGLYSVLWQYSLMKNVRILQGGGGNCIGEMLLYYFVPFYALYWWYSRGHIVRRDSLDYGRRAASGSYLVLLWIFTLGIVPMAIMQHDFNKLA